MFLQALWKQQWVSPGDSSFKSCCHQAHARGSGCLPFFVERLSVCLLPGQGKDFCLSSGRQLDSRRCAGFWGFASLPRSLLAGGSPPGAPRVPGQRLLHAVRPAGPGSGSQSSPPPHLRKCLVLLVCLGVCLVYLPSTRTLLGRQGLSDPTRFPRKGSGAQQGPESGPEPGPESPVLWTQPEFFPRHCVGRTGAGH